MVRKTIFWIHFVVGLVAGLVILLMALTGVVLAFEPQIVAWFESDLRLPQDKLNGEPLPLSELLAGADREVDGKDLSGFWLWSEPGHSLQLQYGRSLVWLNPVSGKVLNEEQPQVRGFFQTVLGLHRWLALSDGNRNAGRWITALANLGFLFLALSGIWLWWPRRWSWNYLRNVLWFRRGMKNKARFFNWHNVVGIWATPLLLVTMLTGVLISFPKANTLLYSLTGSPQPPSAKNKRTPKGGNRRERRQGEVDVPVGTILTALALDAIFEELQRAHPGWKKMGFRVPKQVNEPLKATIYLEDSVNPNARLGYKLDGGSGAVISSERYAEMSKGQQLRSWVKPLHTGEALGLWGQLLAALAALAAVMLVCTGFVLAWYRLFARKGQSLGVLLRKTPFGRLRPLSAGFLACWLERKKLDRPDIDTEDVSSKPSPITT